MEYVKPRRLSLRADPLLTEKWVQARIAEDPSILGLGELDVKDQERMQPRAGRLDMLLFDPETNTRYELELQLGATDEAHIIRTIEYWDIERKRYPQYDHVAVIVAEEITARFFNVINLFNGFIPLIAIQMNALEVNDALALLFTTVLDWMPLGLDEEDEAGEEPRDRNYWEAKGSALTLELTDQFLELVREIEPDVSLKYNKNYVGLARNGIATNFITFRPRRHHVIVEFKVPSSEELTQRLEESGIGLLTYSARWGRYKLRIEPEDLSKNRGLLVELAQQARERYGG